MNDPCEWNPETNAPLFSNEKAHAKAEYIVGGSGDWRLCADCKDLPRFKRYKKVVKI
jgi:hypothetical protein